MSDTTPQQQAVELVAAFIAREVGDPDLFGIMRQQARQLVKALADAGLLCSSPDVQPEDRDGSLRSGPSASCGPVEATGELVSVVAEALRERPFVFGPNTRDSITRGMDKVWLTGAEREDLARMALDAVAEVMRGE